MKLSACLILIGILVLSGCSSKEPVTATNTKEQVKTEGTSDLIQSSVKTTVPEKPAQQTTNIETLNLALTMAKTWTSDGSTSGIETYLQPLDSKETTVAANGTVSAKLYNVKGLYSDQRGDAIQEWNDIKIAKDNYEFMGTKVRLPYSKGFNPKKVNLSRIGWLEVKFVTEDGKEFNAKDEMVPLEKFD